MKNYRIQSGIMLREIAGEYVLISSNQDDPEKRPPIREINESAAFVWWRITEHKSTEDIVALAAQRYQMKPDEIREPLLSVLQEFEELGYIVETDRL